MAEERQSEIKAKLKIADFECSPEEITEILGICPTKIWRNGEKVHPRAKNVYKSNGWMLASPCDPVNSSVDQQIEPLLSIIKPHIDAFEKLPSGIYIELACIIRVADYREPAIWFSADTIRIIAQMRASIDIDVYDFREIEPT